MQLDAYHIWGIALGDLNRPYLQSPEMGRTLCNQITQNA